MPMDAHAQREKQKRLKRLHRIWKEIRPAAVLLISVLIVYFTARFTLNYFVSNYLDPVDKNDATPIEVTIPASASASSIARILYNACGYDQDGLITNTAVFKVYVDFVGKANTMKAGTYVLSKNMTIKQIVDVICEGNPPKATVTFTIPEGYTITDIAKVLVEKGLIASEDEFYAGCKNISAYTSFAFMDELSQSPTLASRAYPLEGYLFPDTYEVYADASVDTILLKMLNRFNEVFTEEYRMKAESMGMSVDQLVTLASLIEREAAVDTDFAKVSAVFHNRIGQDMALQSCASLSYVLNQHKFSFTEEELAIDSPYNTYKNKGLPIGPVSNPGKAAIDAALNPNSEYVSQGYLFFCNGNPAESRELIFSKTYEEHQENVKKYQQYWS